MPIKRLRRRIVYYVVIPVVILAVAVWIAFPIILAAMVRSKLEALVSQHFDAKLKIARVEYHWPYSLTLSGITATADGPDGKIVEVPRVDLSLGKAPWGAGPLIIEDLRITGLRVNLLETLTGYVGQKTGSAESSSSGGGPAVQNSDVIRIQHAAIVDAQITQQDLTHPGKEPRVWKELNFDLVPEPSSHSSYAYHLSAGATPLGDKLDYRGTGDINLLTLDVQQAKFLVQADSDSPDNVFPVPVRRMLRQWHAHGSVEVYISGAIPLSDPRHGKASVEFQPVDLTLQPEEFDKPIIFDSRVMITLDHNQATLARLDGITGHNQLWIKKADIDLTDLPAMVHIQNIDSCITLPDDRQYPPAFAELLASCKPAGPFFVNGEATVDLRDVGQSDYHLLVHTERGRFLVVRQQIPINDVITNIDVTPSGAVITKFEGFVLGGNASVNGKINLGHQVSFTINAAMTNLSMAQLGGYFADPGQPSKLHAGQGALTLSSLSGYIPPPGHTIFETLTGSGEFVIQHGDFWQIPLMKMITDRVKLDQITAVGEAAGQFKIGDSKIHFVRVIVTSPVLGLDGPGDLYFNDARQDFTLVADLLGNWGEHVGALDKTGILAGIADKLQQGVNTVARQALYRVVIKGTADKPEVSAEPAPMLSNAGERLFGVVKDAASSGDLLGALHRSSSTTQPAH